MKTEKYISLLQNLTSNQVQDLIIEYELRKKGYKISYFIDNYDINKYTFPFGLLRDSNIDNRSSLPIEVITDEQLAYHYLINREKKLLLLDEHIYELNKFIKTIDWVEYYEALNKINTLQKYINYFETNKTIPLSEIKEYKKAISIENVSLLISIALGALYDGKKKLSNLRNYTLVYNDNKNIENEFHSSIFKDCKPNIITEKLYDKSTSKDNNIDRLISRYKNCKIYDRLLCINNKTKKQKHIYLLLSSFQFLSKELPNIAYKLNFKIKINDLLINPIRSISQIYLDLLVSNNESPTDVLHSVKKIIEYKENTGNESIRKDIDDLLIEFGNNRSQEQRETFENASLLLNIHNYTNEINKAIKSNFLLNHKFIVDSIKKLLEEANKTEKWKKIQEISLNEIKYYREYSVILKESLLEVEYDKRKLSGFSGLDCINSPYHSLPFVFFNKTNDTFNSLIDNIIELITKTDKNKISGKEFVFSLRNSFELMFEKTMPSDEEKIIMLITLLMLSRDNNLQPNKIALSWVNDIVKNNNYEEKWYLDYLYIQSWINRRIKNYEISIDIAQKGIEKDNDDPRFYQSLYLNYFCKYIENNDINNLDKAIKYCKISFNKYKPFESSNSVKKSISAIINSLMYMYAIKYSLDNNPKYIKLSQTYKKQLKSYCKYYDYSPEFQHTEAYIELQEYYHTKDYIKLCYALKRIEKAINLSDKILYKELKKQIEDELIKINKSC